MSELVLVKYFQPAQSLSDRPSRIDGRYCHPDRWVYCVCYFRNNKIRMVGAEGSFPVDENLECARFLGEYQAKIVERNLAENRTMDGNFYEPFNLPTH